MKFPHNRTLYKSLVAVAALLSAFNTQLSTAQTQGTVFTYQGRLNDGVNPANGSYDFRFVLFDNSGGGSQQGPILTNSASVSNGLFTVTLDFGNQFPGAARWLEIAVRTNGAVSFFTLNPLQTLTPAPYAITAGNVVSGGISSGTYSNAVAFNNMANSFNGSYNGNGGGLTNVNATTLGGLSSSNFWKLGGNTGANPTNGNFLGTTDNLPLDFRVNNERAMRFAYASNLNTIAPNVIGGYKGNSVSNSVIGATITGGGATNLVNQVSGNFGSVIGGIGNLAGGDESVAMGYGAKARGLASLAVGFLTGANGNVSIALGNQCVASGDYSTALGLGSIANGFASLAAGGQSSASNSYAMSLGRLSVASGFASTAAGDTSIASGEHAVALGDSDANGFGSAALGNSIAAFTNSTGLGNSIAAGNYSLAAGQSATTTDFATALGKSVATAYSSTAIGAAKASGSYAVALGAGTAIGTASFAAGAGAVAAGDESFAMGLSCTATNAGSFACGTAAHAKHFGSFVWSDAFNGGFDPFESTADGQFLIRASGGVGIGINNPSAQLHVASPDSSPELQITQNNSADYTRLRMNVGAFQSWEMDVTPGSTPRLEFWNSTRRMYIDFNGNVTATSFNPTSDRNAKEHFAPVNPRDVLDKVAALPITRWNFKEDAGTSHVGPMAQDFYAAFNVGPDDKHIATVDADGVALAAIQGLNQKFEQKLEQKETEIAGLKQRLEALEKIICNQK